ncbi:MAG: pyridoxamine 5'-phosphate oxidase family protein [Myxococcota bacterium]
MVEEANHIARAISDTITRGALKFIGEQSMVVLGSVDHDQNVWASVLFGRPGFVTAPDEQSVEFDLSLAGFNPHDPFWTNIEHDQRVGSLFIDLATRRRLRINGSVSRPSADRLRLDLAVAESYPNCPKYIQRRILTVQELDGQVSMLRDGDTLREDLQTLIRTADTFFVASAHPQRGVDASHRGGPQGFVDVLDEHTLRIPDYVGNNMFNTLGNFAANPKAGLLFLDFDRGRTLQLIGRPEILWNQDDAEEESGGTRRFWLLHVERWYEMDLPAKVQWEFLDYSPFNPQPSEGRR